MEIKHIPVLLNETLDHLNCKKDGIYVDATVGHGNHSLHILKKYPEIKMLVGIDQDIEAIERRHGAHAKELENLMQPHKDAIHTPPFKELRLVFKGLLRSIPSR